jgi:hypothetical protein
MEFFLWYIEGNKKDVEKKLWKNGSEEKKKWKMNGWVGKICITQEIQMDHCSCERMEWHVPCNIKRVV